MPEGSPESARAAAAAAEADKQREAQVEAAERKGERVLEEADLELEERDTETKGFTEMRTQDDLDTTTERYADGFVNETSFTQKALAEVGSDLKQEMEAAGEEVGKSALELGIEKMRGTEIADLVKKAVRSVRKGVAEGGDPAELNARADEIMREQMKLVTDKYVLEGMGEQALAEHRKEREQQRKAELRKEMESEDQAKLERMKKAA